MEYKTVSIVIVNYNGRHHLRECFKSIRALHYPQDKIEVVVVDNGSSDGSVELMQKEYGWVKLLRNTGNEGFAKPSNDGARAAAGEYVAFLNNDMRVQPEWLAELLRSMERSSSRCAGSVILNWDGSLLDFAGGGANLQGLGFQQNFARPMREMEPLLSEDREILFACGGSMLIDRGLFLSAGGFDEDYFAYYEDVDLGWRLHVLGERVMLSVKSRVYHKHNSTSKTIARPRVQYLFERNKLYTCYKNFGDERLYRVFFPTLLLEIRETYLESGIDGPNFDIRSPGAFDESPVQIGGRAAMKLSALNEFAETIARTQKKREKIQQARRAPDETILPLLQEPFMVFPKDTPAFLSAEYDVIKAFGMERLLFRELPTRVLVIDGAPVSAPGGRLYEIAAELARAGLSVTLAGRGLAAAPEGVTPLPYDLQGPAALFVAAGQAAGVLLPPALLGEIPGLREAVQSKYLVVDFSGAPEEWPAVQNGALFAEALRIGDFFVCENEGQRGFVLGALAQQGRRPLARMTRDDPALRLLADVVPADVPRETAVRPIAAFFKAPRRTGEIKDAVFAPFGDTLGAEARPHLQDAPLRDQLAALEQGQTELAQMMQAQAASMRALSGKVKDLHGWSALMERRLSALKRKLGRFPLLRRFAR